MTTAMDAATQPYRQFVEKALDRGFASCDLNKGDDYCKRRLAWLTGAYILDDANRDNRCTAVGLLDRHMVWPSEVIAL